VYASQKGPKASGPSDKASPARAVPKAATPRTSAAPKAGKTAPAPRAARATSKVAKADAKAARADSKTGKADRRIVSTATEPSGSTTLDTGSTGGSTATASTIDFTSTPNGAKLAKNSALRSKVESRLRAIGYEGTVYQAAYGFKNLGQFVAATNVSQNTGTSFDQLKAQMTGLSVDAAGAVLQANLGPDGTVTFVDPADATNPAPIRGLGQAVKELNSTVDAGAAARTATAQADAEIQYTSMASR
jgi:hypothetical protein